MRLAEFISADGKRVAVNPGQVLAVNQTGGDSVVITLGPGLASRVRGDFQAVVNTLDQMMVAE